MAKITKDDWKKKWKSGTYDHIDSSYVPGSHEIEQGNVTWHFVTPKETEEQSGEEK